MKIVNTPESTTGKSMGGKSRKGGSPSTIGSGGNKAFWAKHSISNDKMSKSSKYPIGGTGPKNSPVGSDYTDKQGGKGSPKNGQHIKQQ